MYSNRGHLAGLLSLALAMAIPIDVGTMSGQPSATVTTASASDRGVELSVHYPAKASAGEAIKVWLVLANRSQTDVSYGHVSDYMDFAVQVIDVSGSRVGWTRFGQEKLINSPVADKLVTRLLRPGEELRFEFNLTRVFDLTVSGVYEMSASRAINENLTTKTTLHVTGLRIEILE